VRSDGRVRADVVHERLVATGFTGGERTTRRTAAEVKARLRAGQRRVFRLWVVEPGLWLQWEAERPRVDARRTDLWCAWLAWSRFRVVLAVRDRTLPTIVACMHTTLRRLGVVPTYASTDNEHTVSVDHVAGIAVRHPEIVAVGRHHGMTIRTCVPADPQSEGSRSGRSCWVDGGAPGGTRTHTVTHLKGSGSPAVIMPLTCRCPVSKITTFRTLARIRNTGGRYGLRRSTVNRYLTSLRRDRPVRSPGCLHPSGHPRPGATPRSAG
jgi:hypothetical protein